MVLLAVLALIPWTGERPRPVVPPKPPLAAPCRATDLRHDLNVQGAGGASVGTVRLTNIGRRSCSMRGRPKVAVAGARVGRMDALRAPLEVIRAPMTILRALPRGRTAWFAVHFSNWCRDRAPVLVLTLPGGDRLRIPFVTARCESAKTSAYLAVSPYGPPERTLPPSSRLPFRAEILGAREPGGKPGLLAFRARRGTVLRYVVALTNTSSRSFRFRRCPIFRQQLAPRAPSEPFVLNCRPVRALAPRETARFAMRLRVPQQAPLGRNGLSWLLGPKTHLPPFATSVVIVEPRR